MGSYPIITHLRFRPRWQAVLGIKPGERLLGLSIPWLLERAAEIGGGNTSGIEPRAGDVPSFGIGDPASDGDDDQIRRDRNRP
jgi:hypothetical protein